MGRPINKKFFGNLNYPRNQVPQNNTGTGGESLASITILTKGTYTSALPTVVNTSPTPDLNVESNVAALIGAVHGHALTAVATAAGTGYNLGNVLTPTGSGTGRACTFTVTGLTAVGITLNNGGTANDVGDEFTFSVAGFTIRVRVTGSNAGVATTVSIVDGGVWVSGALPGNTIGMSRTQVAAGQDFNGQGLQVNFTAWGVATVAVADQGNYTAISGGAKATTVSPAGGTGATLTITYGVSGVDITSGGSGYITAPALAFSTGGATGSINLTSTTNTALNITAWVPFTPSNTVNSAGSGIAGDIVKQESSRRYYVDTNQGHGICKLVTAAPAVGEMTIVATDAGGNTYYVKKLTARRAVLVRKTGSTYEFATNSSAGWTLGSAAAGIVSIASI
jgi:hypothetical protein